MNLNDGVMDDLKDLPQVDNDIVVAPGSGQTTGAVKIITTDDPTLNKAAVVPEEVIAKLPEMDVSINLVTEGADKVVNLRDVEQEIIGQEGISRDTAKYLSTSFEALVDGPVKLGEYTLNKSRTNFDYVKRVMKQKIALEENAVLGNVQLLLGAPLNDIKNVYQQTLSTYIPTIESQLYDLKVLAGTVAEAIEQTKNSVFVYGGDGSTFINLSTVNIADIDVARLRESNQIPETILGVLGGLVKMLNQPTIFNFVHSVIDAKSVEECMSLNYRPIYMGLPVTVKDLVKFYQGDVHQYIRYLEQACEERLAKLNEINVQSLAEVPVGATTEVLSHRLSEDLPVIQDCFAVVKRAIELINDLSVLNFAAKQYLPYLSKL